MKIGRERISPDRSKNLKAGKNRLFDAYVIMLYTISRTSTKIEMNVRVTGTLLQGNSRRDLEEVPIDIECAVLNAAGAPSLQQVLLAHGFAILKAEAEPNARYFFFSGSRIFETKTERQAVRLGELHREEESQNIPPDKSYFNTYRSVVEISGGLTLYSEKGPMPVIRTSGQ